MPVHHPDTPDGRYFVVRERLWRKSNPSLGLETRNTLLQDLGAARRAVRYAKGNKASTTASREAVNAAKIALGERGPVWWTDGLPDYNRHLVKNSPYAGWFESVKQLT